MMMVMMLSGQLTEDTGSTSDRGQREDSYRYTISFILYLFFSSLPHNCPLIELS